MDFIENVYIMNIKIILFLRLYCDHRIIFKTGAGIKIKTLNTKGDINFEYIFSYFEFLIKSKCQNYIIYTLTYIFIGIGYLTTLTNFIFLIISFINYSALNLLPF